MNDVAILHTWGNGDGKVSSTSERESAIGAATCLFRADCQRSTNTFWVGPGRYAGGGRYIAVQCLLEGVAKGRHGGKTLFRLLGQRTQENGINIGADRGIECAGWLRDGAKVLVHHLAWATLERGPTSQELIDHGGEGILIGGWDGVSFPLFRGHVDRCAANGLTGTGGSGGQFGDTK